MKLVKSLSAALLCLPLIFAGCASSGAKAGGDGGIPLARSQHKEIPDTSSKKKTSPDPINASLTALELTKLMGNGINLGNTMEAYRDITNGMGTDLPATTYEQLWGQPVTTAEYLKACKAQGFDSIRVPIAWTNAMPFEDGDYTIGTQYLDRIEEIVNYALDADMFVIINDHWDGGWWGMFGSATPEVREDAMELYVSMWTQISNRFKNYGYKLIFEGGNEEIGNRLNDSNICGDSGTLSQDECYAMTKVINQKFVDVVRSTGGNNANRFLLIPGYNTDVTMTCDDRYEMPTDTAKNKLLVSVHFYDPSSFCLGGADLWGKVSDLAAMNNMLEKMTKFTDAGYGVIIGEFGALPSDGDYKTSADVWTLNFLDNCDLYNYAPVLWDIGEWGYFKRKAPYGFEEPKMKEIFATRSYAGQKEATTPYSKIQTAAENSIEDRMDEAPTVLSDNALVQSANAGKSVAWIMYQDKNWNTSYSVGDTYNPDSKSKGLVAKDVEISGPGEYTVSLDFKGMKKDNTGYANGFAFCALGISNGEKNFPGYIVDIKRVVVDGKEYTLKKPCYTCSDDRKCTRVNLFNEWVADNGIKSIENARSHADLKTCSASPIVRTDPLFSHMGKLTITFYYGPAEE